MAKQSLLSAKVFNSLGEIVMVAENSLSWGGSIHTMEQFALPISKQLL